MRRVLAIYLAALFVMGCGKLNFLQKSPGQTVVAAYEAGNVGDYSAVRKLCSEGMNAQLTRDFNGDLDRGLKILLDEWTVNRTLEHVEIIKEIVEDDKAGVEMKVYYKGGQSIEGGILLVKESGSWKLTIE